MYRLFSTIFLALSAHASPRVALYDGAGSAPTSFGNLSASFAALVTRGVLASVAVLDGPGVATRSRAAVDVVVFPGGGGGGEAAGIGAAGAAAVKAFVSSGGGYYGTCAGAYLASAARCCDVAGVASYCGGAVGCTNSSYGLDLINFASAEPWDRGHGNVQVQYNDATIKALRLNPAVYSAKNVSVLYFQGPIVDPHYANSGFDVGATFETEIHALHTKFTTGQMVGAPALLLASHGSGRVLLSPPHPEETVPRLDDVVEAYVLWASGAL